MKRKSDGAIFIAAANAARFGKARLMHIDTGLWIRTGHAFIRGEDQVSHPKHRPQRSLASVMHNIIDLGTSLYRIRTEC